MNKVFKLIYTPFITAQQKAQEEVAPIIMKRYQSAEDIVSKIHEVSGNVVIMNPDTSLKTSHATFMLRTAS